MEEDGEDLDQKIKGHGVFTSLAEVSEERDFVLGHIGIFCFLSCDLGSDPLEPLRKRYPEFNWELIANNGLGDLLEKIKEVDFVWSMSPISHLTATHKKKPWEGVRGFWSDEDCSTAYNRTFEDTFESIEGLGFTVFGELKHSRKS
jgi:hypothetical protein